MGGGGQTSTSGPVRRTLEEVALVASLDSVAGSSSNSDRTSSWERWYDSTTTAEEVTTNQLVVGVVHGTRAFLRDADLPSDVLSAPVDRPTGGSRCTR